MNIKIILLAFISLVTINAHAGDIKGNGADLVACSDKTTLLDFYEANTTDLAWQGTETELVKFMINKLSQVAPERFTSYLELTDSFYSETKFVTESELGPIYDAGNIKVPIPASCKLVQGVIQKHVVFGNEKKYLINKKEWDKLSTFNKAGVIFHELVYRELESLDSSRIRTFNSWLFSTGLEKLNVEVFYSNFKAAGFKWIYLYGYPMDAQQLVIDASPIRSRSSYPNMPFKIFNQTVVSKAHIVDSYKNGKPKLMQYKGELSLETSKYNLAICKAAQNNCRINLSNEGSILFMNNATLTDKLSGETFSDKLVRLTPEGEVEEIL